MLFRIGSTIIISLLIVQVINVTQYQIAIGEFDYWGIEPVFESLLSETLSQNEKTEIEKLNEKLSSIQADLNKSILENRDNVRKIEELVSENSNKEEALHEISEEVAIKFNSNWLNDNKDVISSLLKPQYLLIDKSGLDCSTRAQTLLSQWIKIRTIVRRIKDKNENYDISELKLIYVDLFSELVNESSIEIKEMVSYILEAREHLQGIEGWRENLGRISKSSIDLKSNVGAAYEEGYSFSDEPCLNSISSDNFYSSLGFSYSGTVSLDYWAVSFWLRRSKEGNDDLLYKYLNFTNDFILNSNDLYRSKIPNKITLDRSDGINDFSEIAIIYGGQQYGVGTFTVSVLDEMNVSIKELYGRTKLGDLYRFDFEGVLENTVEMSKYKKLAYKNKKEDWLSGNLVFTDKDLVSSFVTSQVDRNFSDSHKKMVLESIGLNVADKEVSSPYCEGAVDIEFYKYRPQWEKNESELKGEYYSVMERCKNKFDRYAYSIFHLVKSNIDMDYSLVWSGARTGFLSHKNFMSDLDQDGNFEFHFESRYAAGGFEYLVELEADGMKSKVLLDEASERDTYEEFEFTAENNTRFLTVQ